MIAMNTETKQLGQCHRVVLWPIKNTYFTFPDSLWICISRSEFCKAVGDQLRRVERKVWSESVNYYCMSADREIGTGQCQRTRGNTAEGGPAHTDDTHRGGLQLGQITLMRRHEGESNRHWHLTSYDSHWHIFSSVYIWL